VSQNNSVATGEQLTLRSLHGLGRGIRANPVSIKLRQLLGLFPEV